MSKQRYPEEFKTEAVKQITERGHKVADVSARLGVSQHSLYQWIKVHRVPAAERQVQGSQSDELRRLKAELKRVTEERDILKNGHRTLRTASMERNTCRPKLRRASGSGRQLFGGFEPRQKTWSRGSCGPNCGGAIVRPRLGN